MDFRAMLADEQIDLNALGNSFLYAFDKTAHPPPYAEILYEPNAPLNGIFTHLQSLCQRNPHQAGLVNIEASSTQIGSVWGIIDYHSDDYFSTKDLPNQWIKIEFRRHRVSLTDYVYLTHTVSGNGHSASWLVQGTVDGMHWVDVHAVVNTNYFREGGQRYHASFPPTDFFAGVRITQTGTNTMTYHNFRVAKLELFGRLLDLDGSDESSELPGAGPEPVSPDTIAALRLFRLQPINPDAPAVRILRGFNYSDP
jgi:hypothetical protein